MSKWIKWTVIVLLVVAVAVIIQACGDEASSITTVQGVTNTDVAQETTTSAGDTTTTSAGATTTSGDGTTTSGAEAGPTTSLSLPDLSGQNIEVAAVWSAGEQANFEQVLSEFENLTGANVTFTSTGNDIATVLGTRIEGQNPPDVALLPQPGLMRSLVAQNALIPIGDVVSEELTENFDPVFAELGSVDGTLYGFLWKAANKSTFWYNVPALEDAGVEPPQTWDDLLAAAETMLNSGLTPFSIGGADGWTLTDWFENVYLQTAGPDMYDQLAAHEIPWTDPSVRTALEMLAEIFGNSDWIAQGNSGALQVSFPQSVVQVFSDPPEAAFVFEGDFVAGVIASETEAQLETDADFVPFPSIDGAEGMVVAGGDTAVLLKDTEGGRALMQFLASPQSAEIWVALGGFTSPNRNVDPEAYPNPILARAAEDLVNANEVRFDMSDQMPPAFGATPAQGEWRILQDFLVDPTQIDSIMQQLEDAATSAYGE